MYLSVSSFNIPAYLSISESINLLSFRTIHSTKFPFIVLSLPPNTKPSRHIIRTIPQFGRIIRLIEKTVYIFVLR